MILVGCADGLVGRPIDVSREDNQSERFMNTLTTDERGMRREAWERGPGDPFPAEPDDARAASIGNGSRAIRSSEGRGQRTPLPRLPAWRPVASPGRRS